MAHFAKMLGSSFVPFWLPPPRNVACGCGASLIHVDLVLVIGGSFSITKVGEDIIFNSFPILPNLEVPSPNVLPH